MIVVGLTGSVGTGKSTVANLFRELGAYVIDWDELAREVAKPQSKAWQEIVEYFGKDILNQDLTINRQKLAKIVFADKEKLARLNQIIHPEVSRRDEKVTDQIRRRDPDALIIKDIPLLFEMADPPSLDKIIVVSASRETQLRRLRAKGIMDEDARRRIDAQLPLEEKVKRADFVVDNDGQLEDTKRQVAQIYFLLKGKPKEITDRR